MSGQYPHTHTDAINTNDFQLKHTGKKPKSVTHTTQNPERSKETLEKNHITVISREVTTEKQYIREQLETDNVDWFDYSMLQNRIQRLNKGVSPKTMRGQRLAGAVSFIILNPNKESKWKTPNQGKMKTPLINFSSIPPPFSHTSIPTTNKVKPPSIVFQLKPNCEWRVADEGVNIRPPYLRVNAPE